MVVQNFIEREYEWERKTILTKDYIVQVERKTHIIKKKKRNPTYQKKGR